MPYPPDLVAHKPHFHRNEGWKQPVRCATAAPGTLATSFENGDSAGGVTLATGDRVLIKDQAAGTENGIYRVNASGAPTRDFDMDVAAEFVGALIYVVEGTHAGTVWCCTNTTAPTIGATAITFAEYVGGAGFATPAIVLGLAAAAGTAGTVIRSDSTIEAFDATVPETQAYGDSAATGSVAKAARRDHKHGMPAAGLADQGVFTYLDGTVAAAPGTPGAGKLRIYAKTGKVLAVKDDAGLETELGAGGGGVSGVTFPIVAVFDNGTSAITGNPEVDVVVPADGTITGWTLLADAAGSAVIDIWKTAYTDFAPGTHPVDADSITAAAPPTLTAASKATDATLTGWTKGFTAGDILRFHLDSSTTVKRLEITLPYTRS